VRAVRRVVVTGLGLVSPLASLSPYSDIQNGFFAKSTWA